MNSREPHKLESKGKSGHLLLGGRFGYFFSAWGRGRGSPWAVAPGRGRGRFSIEIPRRRGGFSHDGGGGARGREGVCGEFWGGS